MIGANSHLQVVHHLSKKGKTYAQVQAVVPMGKGQIKIKPSETFVRKKDRQPAEQAQAFVAQDEDVPF